MRSKAADLDPRPNNYATVPFWSATTNILFAHLP